MQIAPDILIVAASLLALLGFSASVAGWAERQISLVALASLSIGVLLLSYAVLVVQPGALSVRTIPDAFISVAARLLN
jgi:hypothetical protein